MLYNTNDTELTLTVKMRGEVISTSPEQAQPGRRKYNLIRQGARPRRRNVRSEQGKVPVADRQGEGGCCQVRIEQGSTPLGQGAGGPIDRRSRASRKNSRRSRKRKEESKAKQTRQTPLPPSSGRHCFMIPGAGPWVRGFHVCAGQLGSDRAIARTLLHRART